MIILIVLFILLFIKKENLIQGTLIENEKDNNYKKTYYKGEIQSISYYQYDKDKKLASIKYKNSKPYNGFILEDNKYDKDAKEYNEGDLLT